MDSTNSGIEAVDYQTDPASYRHWQLECDGVIATLVMDVDEQGGLRPDYRLKLNSYDLGVDIELNDALNRIRFGHPEVRCVVITSRKERVFCSGANIFMLSTSSHAWKVNFCKFTNETRNSIEDASVHSGIKFIAAVNGVCAGGGYELALACDEIILVDDRSSSVSLPEVPLLGVLPGTGGLTRITDKRQVRHDLADMFCTTVEGVRGQRAKDWRLVDEVAKPARFEAVVRQRAITLAKDSDRPQNARGVQLTRLDKVIQNDALHYRHVTVTFDRRARTAKFTLRAPDERLSDSIRDIEAAGADWYPLALARELDDAILTLRTNEPEIGTWLMITRGSISHILSMDAALLAHQDHWFVRETIGYWRRTLCRLDIASRSLFAIIDEDSCFVGTLLEIPLVCDRSYHLALPGGDVTAAPKIVLGEVNFGLYPMITGETRLARRFYHEVQTLSALRTLIGQSLDANRAFEYGLVTRNPDDLDWDDEIRMAVEERTTMSPDALTGLEANLRFNGPETMRSRIFGRLSAWQNWIFQRPNAVGERGALKVYGSGKKSLFDWNRV